MFKNMHVLQRLTLPVVLCLFLLLLFVPGASLEASSGHLPQFVGPNIHYLALGDSLAFGYQPNGDYTQGYVSDFFADLQQHGVQDVTDYGCPGETSSTMIYGGCPFAPKSRPQLATALSYLHANAGTVSPVTLDMGINDLIYDSNIATCTVNKPRFYKDLATLDFNLRHIILPALHSALLVNGKLTGDLLLMNYYDPFQNLCPQLVVYTQLLNNHLAQDVRGFGSIVDVFRAFGGTTAPNQNICSYTWICNRHDIHATDTGYSVIANTFERATGY